MFAGARTFECSKTHFSQEDALLTTLNMIGSDVKGSGALAQTIIAPARNENLDPIRISELIDSAKRALRRVMKTPGPEQYKLCDGLNKAIVGFEGQARRPCIPLQHTDTQTQ